MTRTEIAQKKAQYISNGKDALDLARNYLHEHADDWTSTHEEHWINLVHIAEVFVIKATTLDELERIAE